MAADRTFRSKPGKKWSQVYALHAQVQSRFVPVTVAFLTNATTATYLVMFQAVSDWLSGNLGKRWTPKLFLSDFETAFRAAVQRFFDGRIYKVM